MSETQERDYEADARADGWRPQDDWNGDPDKWVDAKTFVERGEKITGILKSKNDRLEDRLHKLEQANRKFGEYHKSQIQKQKKEAEDKIEYLKQKLAEAIDNGDGQTYLMVDKEIGRLQSEVPQDEDGLDSVDPVGQAWLNENPWYGQDPTLSTFADGAADRLRAQGYGGQAYFNELTRMVKEAFPQKFENPNRGKPNTVNDDGNPGDDGDAKEHTFRNLPKDAQLACKEFEDAGIMTRKEYLEAYDWEDE